MWTSARSIMRSASSKRNGLIEAVAQERVARGGMRTIYRITEKGRAEFRDGLHRQFEGEGPVSQTLYGALLFLHLADTARRSKGRSRRRIARLDELIAKLGPDPRADSLRSSRLAATICFGTSTASGGSTRLAQGAARRTSKANGIRDVADPAKPRNRRARRSGCAR